MSNDYSVLVYRVQGGYRVDEFVYSRPFERVVSDYIKSGKDIIDVSAKDRITILTYKNGVVRCIVDNNYRGIDKADPTQTQNYKKEERENATMNKMNEAIKDMKLNDNNGYATSLIKSYGFDADMVATMTDKELHKAYEFMTCIDLDVFTDSEKKRLYEHIPRGYATLEEVEEELTEHEKYNCLSFDSDLSSLLVPLLDELEKSEIMEHITGTYGYIEIFYLYEDDTYAIIME